jgi:hypothetical protein
MDTCELVCKCFTNTNLTINVSVCEKSADRRRKVTFIINWYIYTEWFLITSNKCKDRDLLLKSNKKALQTFWRNRFVRENGKHKEISWRK